MPRARARPRWLHRAAGLRLRCDATWSSSARPHPQQHAVAPYELMPESREHVNADESEQRVRQITVNVLGGIENRPVLGDAEVHLEEPEVEGPAVPDEGD